MAGRNEQIAIDITAKDNASKVIDKLAKKIDGMEADEARITVTAETSKLEKQLDRARQKLEGLAGDEATVQARLIGTIEEDLEQANKLLEQLDGATATVKIDAGGAKQGIDELGKSADSSKSVLANMVGNTTQDLGALGGVAGSAGVAIGQMGEYMADAAGSGQKFKSILMDFGNIAVPLAAIGVAVQGIATHFKNVAKVKAFRKEEVKGYADALKEADSVLGAIRAKLEAAEGLSFNVFGKDEDVTKQFIDLGLNADRAAKLIAGGVPAIQEWSSAMEAAGANGDKLEAVSYTLTMNAIDLAEAQRLTAEAAKFFAEETDKVAKSHQQATDETDANRAALDRHADALDEARDRTDDLKRANQQLRGELDNRSAYLNLLDTFDELKVSAEEAWYAAAAGADNAGSLMRDYEQDVIGARIEVQNLLDKLGLATNDPKRLTIQAYIDEGLYLQAAREIEALTKPQVVDVTFNVIRPRSMGVGSAGGGGVPERAIAPTATTATATAYGAPVTASATSTAPELVLPVRLQLPSASQISRQIGPLRLAVTAALTADRRLAGVRD